MRTGGGRRWQSRASGAASAVVAIVTFLVAGEAAGQTATLAESLFRDARSALKANDLDHACPLFQESYRLDPAIGTLFNLAACEQTRGKLATAWATFRKFLDLAPPHDERAAVAKEHLSALEPRLPRLTIELPAQVPDDCLIELDGILLGVAALRQPLPVDPGKHTVVVKHQGAVVQTDELEIEVGQLLAHEVRPFSAPAAALPTEQVHEAPSRVSKQPTRTHAPSRALANGAYTALGIGAGVLGSSAVLGILAIRQRELTQSHCDDTQCDDVGQAAANRGDAYATLATAGAVVGGIALAAGGGILLWESHVLSMSVVARGTMFACKGTF